MPDAARLGDTTAHNATIDTPCCPTVRIGGQLAARVSDQTACPLHSKGMISKGSATVRIGGLPAARVGDEIQCGPGTDTITQGCARVRIGG